MGFGLQSYPDKAPALDGMEDRHSSYTEKFYEFFERRFEQFALDKAFQRKLITLVVGGVILLSMLVVFLTFFKNSIKL